MFRGLVLELGKLGRWVLAKAGKGDGEGGKDLGALAGYIDGIMTFIC